MKDSIIIPAMKVKQIIADRKEQSFILRIQLTFSWLSLLLKKPPTAPRIRGAYIPIPFPLPKLTYCFLHMLIPYIILGTALTGPCIGYGDA